MDSPKRGRPKQEHKLENISLRLPADQLAELREFAENTDRTVTGILRRIIDTHLPEYMEKAGPGIAKSEEKDEDLSNFILTLESGVPAA